MYVYRCHVFRMRLRVKFCGGPANANPCCTLNFLVCDRAVHSLVAAASICSEDLLPLQKPWTPRCGGKVAARPKVAFVRDAPGACQNACSLHLSLSLLLSFLLTCFLSFCLSLSLFSRSHQRESLHRTASSQVCHHRFHISN